MSVDTLFWSSDHDMQLTSTTGSHSLAPPATSFNAFLKLDLASVASASAMVCDDVGSNKSSEKESRTVAYGG